MGRRGISRDDMQNAIKILESKHESVSAIAIRNELGTGSLTTIQNFLKERRDEQGEQHRVKREIPEDLTATSETMLIKLWAIAESLASSDVEVLRKATTAEIVQLRSELTAVCESFDTMNDEYEACQEHLKTALVRSAELEKALTEAMSAKAALVLQYKLLTEGFSASAEKIESVVTALQEKEKSLKAKQQGY